MASNDSRDYPQQRSPGSTDRNCDEKNSPTQKTISAERQKYCDKVYEAAGVVYKWEKYKEGQLHLEERKKCFFVWTEGNYRRYRNTEIKLGTELLTSNELVKENVTNYIKWGAELSGTLKSILKAVGDAKIKMNDLREAACKLENCKNDSCNCTQLALFTGKNKPGCKEDPNCPPNRTPSTDRPQNCENAECNLSDLICMPKALGFDIDSVAQASSEVIGIQVFSNLGTLKQLQETLSEKAKTFESHLQLTMKTREMDLKKAQEELIKAVQESTRATIGMYARRSDFEGALSTVQYLCCPDCGCVLTNENCEPRLHECKCNICDICNDVKDTFCADEPETKVAY